LSRPRAFVAVFLTLIFVSATAMVAINVIVDPFRRFDVVDIPGFNAQKTQFPTYARLAKAGVVCRLQPTTVILGTSRVEVGMDPTHPALQSFPGRAYNLALAGSGLHELDLTMRHAVHASSKLKRVLLGIDFLMFNANREAVVFGTEVFHFDERRLLLSSNDTCWRTFLFDLDLLLGPKALLFSWTTVRDQELEPTDASSLAVNGWIANYDRNGYRNNFYILQKVLVPNSGYHSLFGKAQERDHRGYVSQVWRPPPDQRYCFTRDGQPSAFATFRGILDFARNAGVDLHIFINPIHARLLLALRDAGLWPQYEEWKKEMVEVLAAEAKASGKRQFPLWDFSGFNSVTTEPVPPAGDTKTVMKGFWHQSHYKKELGDLMIDRMFNYTDPARAIPADFGKLLTLTTIDDWINETRAQMRTYMVAQSADTELVGSIVDKAMANAEGANCGEDVRVLREASAAQSRGDLVAAAAGFARAEAMHEADRQRYIELGVPYREIGFDHLLAEAKAGIELKPPLPNWQAYQQRGIQRSHAGDYYGAADDFAAAIRIGPPNTALHHLRGTALLHARDFSAAAAEFETGLQLEPTNKLLAQSLQQARGAEKAQLAIP
jgi:hypothetical protein